MQILDDEQLDAVIQSYVNLQRELLPRATDLTALLDEMEGAQAGDRGYAGLVNCIGEPAAAAVRANLGDLRYAFPLIRMRLLESVKAQDAGSQQAQFAAMMATLNASTADVLKDVERLLNNGSINAEHGAALKAELQSLSQEMSKPAATPVAQETMESLAKVEAVLNKAEAELVKELEKLLAAAKIEPEKIIPNLPKAEEPPPKTKGAEAKGASEAKPASEQELNAQVDKSEQSVRSHLPQLHKQLTDAGVDQAHIAEIMAALAKG